MNRKTNSVGPYATLGLVALLALPGLVEAGDTDWRQVGLFRSNGRNLTVGDSAIRVVSMPNFESLGLTGDIRDDSARVARAYPGWDYRSDLVVYYRLTSDGVTQDSFFYELGQDFESLPGDTVSPTVTVFDFAGERRAEIPGEVHRAAGSPLHVMVAAAFDWSGDGRVDWVVGSAGSWDSRRQATTLTLQFLEQSGGTWQVIRTHQVKEQVRCGPLEVRDVTGDGQTDVVFRCFHETLGHYWIDAHIFSRHDDMPAVFLPRKFNPGIAAGPIRTQ